MQVFDLISLRREFKPDHLTLTFVFIKTSLKQRFQIYLCLRITWSVKKLVMVSGTCHGSIYSSRIIQNEEKFAGALA